MREEDSKAPTIKVDADADELPTEKDIQARRQAHEKERAKSTALAKGASSKESAASKADPRAASVENGAEDEKPRSIVRMDSQRNSIEKDSATREAYEKSKGEPNEKAIVKAKEEGTSSTKDRKLPMSNYSSSAKSESERGREAKEKDKPISDDNALPDKGRPSQPAVGRNVKEADAVK
jgi:hypothetical protein